LFGSILFFTAPDAWWMVLLNLPLASLGVALGALTADTSRLRDEAQESRAAPVVMTMLGFAATLIGLMALFTANAAHPSLTGCKLACGGLALIGLVIVWSAVGFVIVVGLIEMAVTYWLTGKLITWLQDRPLP